MFSVANSVLIQGGIEEVYECFWNPHLWTRITPHVKRVEMIEESANFQQFKMEVISDGKNYSMETQRRGRPLEAILYQQLEPPPFLLQHKGEWNFSPSAEGVKVTLIHRVEMHEGRACELLGALDLEDARRRICAALERNGSTTMSAIKTWVEGRATRAN